MGIELYSQNEKRNGIWFFGLAGSGKTFASKICAEAIQNGFLIDGDDVRKLVSFDLGYSLSERIVQVSRVLGIAQIALSNHQFPIISTVSMNKEIYHKCSNIGIDVVQIIRPIHQLHKVRNIYENEPNVVGKSILQVELHTNKLHNDGDQKFEDLINAYVK